MLTVQGHSGWVASPSIGAAARIAPNSPGVYAIGQVKREAGLPVEVEWVYVGRSTKGLRNRLNQHEPIVERNEDLRWWLSDRHADTEVWFTTTATESDAVALEAELILSLDPRFNTVGKRKAKEVIER
jgi:excinuclease UvrABC nuclease subunit